MVNIAYVLGDGSIGLWFVYWFCLGVRLSFKENNSLACLLRAKKESLRENSFPTSTQRARVHVHVVHSTRTVALNYRLQSHHL